MVRIDNRKKLSVTLNITAMAAFIGIIAYISIRYTPQVIALFEKRQELKTFIDSKGTLGIGIFILFQVLQVVVAAIPGEVVQLAGGYFYGTLPGTVYLVIGVILGSIIVFYASRLLGYGLVKTFVPQKKLEQFTFMVNGQKSEILMFILFLIPGIPKDILTYIAGLTPVKPVKFLIIAVVGRLPALIVSSYIGANLQEENYTVAIIAGVSAIILFAAGLLLKDKLISLVQNMIGSKRTKTEGNGNV